MQISLKIENIKKCVFNQKITWTKHCLNRLEKRNISIKDVKQAIMNGNIIEHYDKDYPYPSCLILGHNNQNKIIHIVCGIDKEMLFIITAYYPDTIKWEEDMKTRRLK